MVITCYNCKNKPAADPQCAAVLWKRKCRCCQLTAFLQYKHSPLNYLSLFRNYLEIFLFPNNRYKKIQKLPAFRCDPFYIESYPFPAVKTKTQYNFLQSHPC